MFCKNRPPDGAIIVVVVVVAVSLERQWPKCTWIRSGGAEGAVLSVAVQSHSRMTVSLAVIALECAAVAC